MNTLQLHRHGITSFMRVQVPVVLVVLCCMLLPALPVFASIPNHVYRVDIRPGKNYTRLTVRLADPPEYSVSAVPGNRLRLVIQDTDGTLFRRYRRYSDPNIGGLVFSRRDGSLLVTFQIASKAGWRNLSRPGVPAITLDVGASFKALPPHPYVAGREKIWNGVEKLVKDFDPPVKSEIPFTPTDRQILKAFLDDGDQKLFMAGEAALYKGRLSDAEEIFNQFATRQTNIRPLALYRLGETWYKLQKYPQALTVFRDAEKLWPAFLTYNPGVTFYYGDSIARSGDLPTARALLSSLVARLADKKFAPALLVRLGDILSRQGYASEALALYRTVADNFQDNKANGMARMRLADLDFLQATPWNYRPLSDIYREVSFQGGDIDMREESTFKYVLLESINGEASEALQLVLGFQRKFPRGVYAAVMRTIREVLVSEIYRHTHWDKDASGLIRFVEEHHDYLAGCIEQPGFLKFVTHAYDEVARPIELVTLLNTLVDRQWSSSIAPEIYLEIADHAEIIGDVAATERSLKAFLKKFPTNPRSRLVMERLGGIYFAGDKHQQVSDTLLWLLNKGEKANKIESYYHLGHSLLALQQYGQAAKAIDMFLASSGSLASRFAPDAYHVAISARELTGDRKGALKLLDNAVKIPDARRKEEFLYKAGELNVLADNKSRARGLFEQIIKSGKDADWQRLAQQSLLSLDSPANPR